MKKYIVIDIGGTYIKYGLITDLGLLIKKGKIKTERFSFDIFLNNLDFIIHQFDKDVHGIGISMPGKIDFKRGIAITGGSLHFIENTPLVEILEKRYCKPITIANDGHCATLAELWQGSLNNCQNGVCMVFGTGIGGAIVINNELFEGSHFTSGELSCMISSYKHSDLHHYFGTRCSTKALLRNYSHQKEPTIDGITFFDKVRKKEEKALKIYHLFLKEVAAALYSIQTIIDCDIIAIGGGISEVDFLVKDIAIALDNQFQTYSGFPVEKPKIVKCTFGNDANLIGALKYHLKKYE